MPEACRVAELQRAGADFVAKINFSREISTWDAEKFLTDLRDCGLFKLAGICVGSNWKFGRNGSGNRELLAEFCRNNGIEFLPVNEVEDHGKVVSSTLIRQLTAAGEIEEVHRICGNYPRIYGTVRHGMQAASRDLKAPTANMELQYGVMVPDGVYAGSAEVDGCAYPAVLNIGTAPTYDIKEKRIEVHLLNFSGDLYGKFLAVSLRRKLRDIRKFESVDELKNQIASDIKTALEL
jgi:riboflavin kinase/FMN adenylyltransferase